MLTTILVRWRLFWCSSAEVDAFLLIRKGDLSGNGAKTRGGVERISMLLEWDGASFSLFSAIV